MTRPYPILEFDPDPQAILNPGASGLFGKNPGRCVLCFFMDVIQDLVGKGELVEVGRLGSEMGPNPVYQYTRPGGDVLVFHPGVGAPLAGAFLDELVGAGVNRFIACGGCGVLESGSDVGHPFILTAAVRDEGTSYHYLPPGREVAAHPVAVAALEQACREHNLEYRLAKTWTTDGYYRETRARRALRLLEGCQVVEMEAAAFFAVAQFRGVTCGQIVYAGDLVIPEGWDMRAWADRGDIRRYMFQVAVDAALLL
jgi:purine-nucleoside phosphorylase